MKPLQLFHKHVLHEMRTIIRIYCSRPSKHFHNSHEECHSWLPLTIRYGSGEKEASKAVDADNHGLVASMGIWEPSHKIESHNVQWLIMHNHDLTNRRR